MSAWKSPLLYLGIALIVLAGVAFAAPLFVDWNSYRSQIEAYGKQLTGRDVTIAGAMSARLFPWPRLRLEGVEIANPPGAGLSHLLKANEVDVRMGLAPLLSGRIRVEGVTLHEPAFGFERLANGIKTWQLDPQLDLQGLITSDRVAIDGVVIKRGTIRLADGRRDGIVTVEALNARVSAPALSGPWRLRGDAVVAGKPAKLAVSSGKLRPGSPLKFAIRLTPAEPGGLVYALDGELGELPRGGVTGNLRIKPNTGDSAAAPSGDEDGLNRLVFNAEIVADFDKVTLTRMELAPDRASAGGTLLSGTASMTLGPTLEVKTKLVAAQADLDFLLGAEEGRPAGSGQVLEWAGRFLNSIPQELTADVDLSITSLILGGESLDGFHLKSSITSQRLNIHEVSASMPGQANGSFSGIVVAGADAPQLAGKVKLTAVSAKDFTLWMFGRHRKEIERIWSGARGRLSVETEFESTPQLLRLRDGSLSFDDTKGLFHLSYADGDTPRFLSRLTVDRINADRYIPGVLSMRGGDGIVAKLTDLIAGAMSFAEFQVTLQADSVRLNDVQANDIAVDIVSNESSVELRAVEIGRVGDARVEVTGLLNFPETGITGSLAVNVTAKEPAGLIRLLGLTDPAKPGRSEPAWLTSLGPIDMKLMAEAASEDKTVSANAHLVGVAAGSDVDVTARFTGQPADWRQGKAHLSGTLSGQSSPFLDSLAGLRVDSNLGSPARIALTSTGKPISGMASTIEIETLGSQMQFAGMVRMPAGLEVEADGRIAVLAERAHELYKTLGVAYSKEGGPAAQVLSAEGAFTFKNGVADISELSGTAAGTAFGGRIRVGERNGRRHADLDLKAGRLNLPWLMGWILLEDDPNQQSLKGLFDLEGDGLRGNVTLNVSARRLETFPSIDLRDATLSFDGEGPKGTIDVIAAGAGNERSAFKLEYVRQNAELKTKGSVSGTFALPMLLRDTVGDSVLTGALRTKFEFQASGRSPAGLLAAMEGEGSFALADGAIANLNPAAFADALQKLDKPADLETVALKELLSGSLPLGGIAGALQLGNGLITFSRIELNNPAVSGRLKVLVEMQTGEVDLSALMKLSADPKLPSFEVALAGPAPALERSTDLTALKSYVTVNSLTQGIGKLEKLQREQQRLFEEEMAFEREQVMREKLREWERKKVEEARKKAEEEARRKQEDEDAKRKADQEVKLRRQDEMRAREADERRAQRARERELLADKAHQAATQPIPIPRPVPGNHKQIVVPTPAPGVVSSTPLPENANDPANETGGNIVLPRRVLREPSVGNTR